MGVVIIIIVRIISSIFEFVYIFLLFKGNVVMRINKSFL